MEPQQPSGPSNNVKIATTIAILLVAVLLVAGIKAFAGKDEDNASTVGAGNTTNVTPNTSASSASGTDNAAASGYKDGAYSATGTYSSPGGAQEITVSITLKDGAVTETSATEGASDGQSSGFQAQFISGYKELVIGKSIDEVKLSRVSGSSLTSQGFNDAIDAIKDQAKP